MMHKVLYIVQLPNEEGDMHIIQHLVHHDMPSLLLLYKPYIPILNCKFFRLLVYHAPDLVNKINHVYVLYVSSENDLVLVAGGELFVRQYYSVEHYQFRLHRHSLTWGRWAHNYIEFH